MAVTSNTTIELTENIKVNEGSHILYFYQSEKRYLENLVSFILTARRLEQYVIVIETTTRYKMMKEKLALYLSRNEIDDMVHYVNSYEFYQMYDDFKFERVLENLKQTIQPFINDTLCVRIWGLVDWKDQPNIMEKLYTYECECDVTVKEVGYLTVCCYNSNDVPSYTLTELMRSHPYLLTDKELVKSPLYNHTEQTIFPTLAAQGKIESELDFYKQKLDFIHVIAHEVRNPLTVIKSFAAILKSEIPEPDVQAKLSLIEDYSTAIDHEINHIIQTEQMLTRDSFWKKKRIKIEPLLDEVIDIMRVKARTQNIIVETNINIPTNTQIVGNIMGFKLIISNLLSNAIKYSFENNTVGIDGYINKDKLYIEITDQGVGISNEDLDKLFQKYQKINENVSGQGIGLFMVYKLIDHFSGEIKVESEHGKGTFVQVILPL